MKSKTMVLFGRLMKHIIRSPDTIITVAIMTIAMMLLFVYVFGGAVKSSLGAGVNYVNCQLPGILLIAIASGIAYTAFRLFGDMENGLFARFNAMPVKRSSMLWANVLTSLVSTMFTLAIISLASLLMGFRSGAGI
jgi:ABC-2 type transport system permease protein